MNWEVFFIWLGIAVLACIITGAFVFAIDRGIHPAWLIFAVILSVAIAGGILSP